MAIDAITYNPPSLSAAVAVGPTVDVESWRLTLPAGGGCYLMCAGDGRAVMLGTAANLRSVLVNRLSPPDADAPPRTTDYRQVVRRVHWAPAYSRFEANWCYLEHARRLFPSRYRQLVKHWRSNWITIDPAERFPRFTVAAGPGSVGRSFGPIATSRAARGAVEAIEDVFDLCRYHEVLVKAPHGEACAYKEMGKCPAPCDGSVPMDHYANRVAEAVAFLEAPQRGTNELERDMRKASKDLAFELAGKLKDKRQRCGVFFGQSMAHCRAVERFGRLLVERGRGTTRARFFVVTAGRIGFAGELQKRDADLQLEWLAERVPAWLDQPPATLDQPEAERLDLVCWHLHRSDRESGVWLDGEQAASVDTLRRAVAQVNEPRRGNPADRLADAVMEGD